MIEGASVDDLRAYFVRNVVGDYQSYRAYRREGAFGLGRDTKLALYAALSQLHLMDHVLEAFRNDRALLPETDVRSLFGRLRQKTPDFKLICDCGNALKHYRVERHQPVIDGMMSVKDYPAIIRRSDSEGAFYVTDKPVFALRRDGLRIDLGAALLSGLFMWSEELVRLGVIQNVPKIATEPLVIHPPVKDRASVTVRMEAMAGEPISEQFLTLVHDEALGVYREAQQGEEFNVSIQVELKVDESLF